MRACIAAIGLAVLALGSAGCSGNRPVQAQVLLNHQQCQTLRAGVTEVRVEQIAAIRGSRLLQHPDAQSGLGSPATATPLSAATRLFAVSRGAMPTPGYQFEMDRAELADTTLTLALHWRTPAADSVQPQVQTHPCMVIALPVAQASTLVVRAGEQELGRMALAPPGPG